MGADGRAQTGFYQCRCNRPRTLAALAIGLSNGDAVAFGVANDAGLDDLGREIHDRADHAPAFDGRCHNAAWIDTLEPLRSREIPPRNAVLHRDDDGGFMKQRPQMRGERRHAVRLHANNYDIHGTRGVERIHYPRPRLEIALLTLDAYAVLLHGAAVP